MGHSLGKSIASFRQGLQEAQEEFSGAMKETTEASGPKEANVTASPPLSARTAAVTPEPALAEPAVKAMEN